MRAIFEQEGASRAQMEESVLRHYSTTTARTTVSCCGWKQAAGGARSAVRVGFNACLRELREVVANTCGSFPSMGTPPPMAPENWRASALSDGQFSYAFDPQTITDEVTEAVLAAFFRRIVFGEPTPE